MTQKLSNWSSNI